VTVIQLTVLVAVHEQLVPVMTDTALVDPVEGTDTLVGVTVGLAHCADADCAEVVCVGSRNDVVCHPFEPIAAEPRTPCDPNLRDRIDGNR